MISRDEIREILREYKTIRISTLCSHSALQIFHGAKKEGFETVGICLEDRVYVYESFPLAKPDYFITINSFDELPELTEKLRELNSIIIPHASLIAHVGVNKVLEMTIPMFGNRLSLLWESNREKQFQWLKEAGLKVPRTYSSLEDMSEEDNIFVKFHGAKGGEGYFVVKGGKLKRMVEAGEISLENVFLQEFIPGVRYYPHYFNSLIFDRVELLSMDKRVETIDESYRGWLEMFDEFRDYTVSGNIPVIVRESLLRHIISMGIRVVETSKRLFYPGIVGPFCLETIYNPKRGFFTFEISARIVAGTNLFPNGSFYSWYIFDKPMSTGRRIAYEIRLALEKGKLEEVVY